MSENIENLRKKLNEVYRVTVIENKELTSVLFEDFLRIMSVKDSDSYTLKNEIIKLLESHDEHIRDEVVKTLGSPNRLFLPEFKDMAFEIFLKDPSSMVKSTALACWCDYYFETKNKKTLLQLYEILMNNDYHPHIRAEAYTGIFITTDNNYPGFDRMRDFDRQIKCKTSEEFNHNVNWDAVNKLMLQYAPEALKE